MWSAGQPPPAGVVIAAAASWLGFFLHNAADLPREALLGPETIAPTAVYLLVLGAWWVGPRLASWLLLVWGWLQAVGGGLLSVLPLPLWPFAPEQSVRHYAFHAVYAVLQIPLLILLMPPSRVRNRSRPRRRAVRMDEARS